MPEGLTLDNLVHLANQQLTRLHGRYLLQRKASEALEVEVVDTWQADAVRDTRTLSGGESFLVSLALALALSDLVSHKTRIDSLFLDEGFGTLDSETLDTALDALDALNASGKTIGVISHVEAMKERIPVQIKVKDQRHGLQQTGKYVCSEITIQQDNEYRGANYLLALLVVILQAITLLATVIGSRSGGCDGGMKKSHFIFGSGHVWFGDGRIWHYGRAHGAGA